MTVRDCTLPIHRQRGCRRIRRAHPPRTRRHRGPGAEAGRRTVGFPHRSGVSHRTPGPRRAHQSGDRCAAVHQPPDRRVAHEQNLRQIRNPVQTRASCSASRLHLGVRTRDNGSAGVRSPEESTGADVVTSLLPARSIRVTTTTVECHSIMFFGKFDSKTRSRAC